MRHARALLPRLAAVVAAAAASTTLAQPPEATFSDVLDVTVVNVDVHVVDRKGAPITGLTREAFQLFEEKKKLKPTYFSEIVEDGEEPAWLVLLVDGYNLRTANRDRALQEILRDLQSLLESRPLPTMVAKIDDRFAVVQEFTKDVAAVRAALESFAGTESVGDRLEPTERAARNTIDEMLRQVRGSPGDRVAGMTSLNSVMAEMRGYGQRQYEDVQRTVATLNGFVRSMAVVPGRKVVVYLSDGLPMQPGDSLMRTLQSLTSGAAGRGQDLMESQSGQAGDSAGGNTLASGVVSRDVSMELSRMQQDTDPFNSRPQFEALVAQANTYRLSFYPIKAPAGSAAAGEGRTTGGGGGLEISDKREALEYLASGTGGLAFTSEGGVEEVLAEVLRDLDHYYSLGIEAEKKQDGDYVPLRVKVKQRGARVRYRESYVHREFWGRLADRTVGGMVLGVNENPHEMEVSLVAQRPAEEGKIDVQLDLEMPIGKIGLAAANGIHSARSSLAVAAMDASSAIVAASRLQVPLQVPEAALESALSQYYRAAVSLRLPAGGEYRVGFGLWDRLLGRGSFVTESISVEAP